ncbi:MAG: hemolysin family protein [Geminicoccaceae bacterium]|jgi:CBS domain containing-hemolysin-like protein|nr:hemolysin family protein [Geminicoccaceae bacterium]
MRQLARRQDTSPSMLEGLLRRLRELASGESSTGGLRETLEDLLEEEDSGPGAEQFTPEERELVLNALSFGELRVDDVMVPRADIRAIEINTGLDDVVAAMREAGHSRLLVFRDRLDDVVGLVHIKDLLPFWGDGGDFALSAVMRQVPVVPPSMRVLDLLLEMRKSHAHMVAVVDEFGGTDGLVTVEDLVVEILGEIHDEHAPDEPPQLVHRADGSIEADGRVDLEDLEEQLGQTLLDGDERDEVDTLGGLIFTLVDRVPDIGESVHHPVGLTFHILDADPRRIKRVRIEIVDPEERQPRRLAGELLGPGD